jgi:hypothetical protein
MAGGTGPSQGDPWLAADALREVADARRSVAASAKPSPWPRAAEAAGLGAMLAALAIPGAWTGYLVIALGVAGPALSGRVKGGRVQLNGLQERGHAWRRAGALAGVDAAIALDVLGKLLWGWPPWTPAACGIAGAAVFFAAARWFDLRLWREWSGR